MGLEISVQFGKDNLSEQLNRRFAGILVPGIYQGFEVEPVPGQMQIRVSRGGKDVSSAIVEFGKYTLAAIDETETIIDVASEITEITRIIVIDARYQWGLTLPVDYKVIDPASKEAHQLEICRLVIPANEVDSNNITFDREYCDYALKVEDVPAMQTPVGSIVAIHPGIDANKAVDSNHYVFCNNPSGTEQITIRYPDGSKADIFIPDLTDNRFLMGASTYGTGGSNVLLDHTHSASKQTENHTHSHSHGSTTGGNESGHGHKLVSPGASMGDLGGGGGISATLAFPLVRV